MRFLMFFVFPFKFCNKFRILNFILLCYRQKVVFFVHESNLNFWLFSAKITQNRGFEIVFFKVFLFAEGNIVGSGRSLVRFLEGKARQATSLLAARNYLIIVTDSPSIMYLEYPVLYILYTLYMISIIMCNVYNI